MYGNNWLRISSRPGLLIASLPVVAQSLTKTEVANQLYYGTTVIAVFVTCSSRVAQKKKSAIRPGGGKARAPTDG
jgi:hypothetical protein